MRRYDMGFKIDAVKLALELGTTRAAKELDIPQGTLDTWVSKEKRGELDISTITPQKGLSLADEVKKLQQENRELKRTNEILRKASAFFAQGQRKQGLKRGLGLGLSIATKTSTAYQNCAACLM